jgi:hypothetical protein
MKIRRIIWTVLLLIVLQKNDMLHSIPGTDADGSNNYAISIGNDDCFVTAQSGDSLGIYSFCEPFPNPPKAQDPILPSFRRGDGIF